MEEAQAQSILDPETEFLASKRQTGNEWELYKENVRPLKRGRKVDVLNEALKSQSDNQLRKSLNEKRRSVENPLDLFLPVFTLWLIFLIAARDLLLRALTFLYSFFFFFGLGFQEVD